MEIDVVPALAGLTAYQAVGSIQDDIDALEYAAATEPSRRAQALLEAQEAADLRESLPQPPEEEHPVDFTPLRTEPTPAWEEYVGQERLKRELRIAINSAKRRGARLDHVLLASGYPGVGKTTMARIIAEEMDVRIKEIVPPFTAEGLANAARDLNDGDILFIDEIHKLSDGGAKGSEILLKLLEDHVIPVGWEVIRVADITVIGATTEADLLKEPVLDRFKITPEFEPYSLTDLVQITCKFMGKLEYDFDPGTDDDLIMGIAAACKRTPRKCEKFVMAARDLEIEYGRKPTIDEVLEYKGVEPDGMERKDVKYLLCMYKQGRRTMADGSVQFIAGEATLMAALRETKKGVQRIERFLLEQGYLERTPSGRRLTEDGIETAAYFDNL